MKVIFTSVFFVFMAIGQLTAQQSGISGKVIDGATGDPLFTANVSVKGTSTGTTTDFDGKYVLNLDPGTYNIQYSFIGYAPVTITGVEVKEGEKTVLNPVSLKQKSQQLKTYTVTAESNKNSETAILTMKRKSENLLDGISSASFKKIGDSDAASSMKRVTGVSVQGGKYVYVRGLGDRYTKTMLNGLDVPGLDPDRNTLQMDIFPTDVIDNIVVNKSFVAELPADFTGGVVNITTKSFPDQREAGISVSAGYNPNFHFNSDYLTYQGSSTDALGFDNGTRDIPAEKNIPLFAEVIGSPDSEKGQRYQDILSSFNPTMATMKQMSIIDFGIGGHYGNQVKKENVTLGYNFMLNYANKTEFYEDAVYARYGLDGDPDVNEMEQREYQKGNYGVNNVLLNAMGGFAIKTDKAKYKINLLHIQNGVSKAGQFDYENSDQGAVFEAEQHNLEYSERSLTNMLISGKHYFNESDWKLEWKLSPTYSSMDDPDIRFTRYQRRGEAYSIGTEVGFPQRIWRDLDEINLSNRVDLKRNFTFLGGKSNLKFGAAYTFKERDFTIRNFDINVRDIPLTGNPDELFYKENLWPYNGNINRGVAYEPKFIPTNPNDYTSNVNYAAAYVSSMIRPTTDLSVSLGLRMENYVQRYTGQDQLGTNVLNNEEVLNDLGFYPSVNVTYALNDKQNIRASYSQTVARPSFKELSYAEIYDPLTGRTFIGGLFRDADDGRGVEYWDGDLTSSYIQNVDVRWDFFPTYSQTVSVGAFYKSFDDPIEIVQFATQAGAFQPRNVGDGEVYGAEVEVRQGLGIITDKLENWKATANVTLVESRIRLSLTEYESRVNNARTGQEVDRYRDMAGQAPYIINAGFSYSGTDSSGVFSNFDAALFYNVQGPTLQYTSIVDRPDIYTVPFHSLNLNTSKKFGKDNQMQVGLKVSNILNDYRESVFKSYKAEDQYFTRLRPATTISASFKYEF